MSNQELANDPEYQSLHAATQQAQANVQNVQDEIASIQQQITAQGSGSSSLFKTIDAPHTLNQPVSRVKTYLIVGGIALAVALLACVLYLLTIVRRDHSIYTPLELQKVTDLPVLLQLPHLEHALVPALTQAKVLLDD
jgi:uncharacterized protein involved in exopolysaccharide biosynthesis